MRRRHRLSTGKNIEYAGIGLEGVKWPIIQSLISAFSRGRDGAASNDAGQLDFAGRAILQLLHKAAGTAEANSRHALETAQSLSSQLRAAEDRVAELEAEVHQYRERAERAEEWLATKDATSLRQKLRCKCQGIGVINVHVY